MTSTMEQPRSVEEVQDEIAEDFALFDNDRDKIDYIMDLGKKLPPLPDEFMTEQYIVRGCQSKVWLHATREGGRIHFAAQSNTILVSGLISLLLRVYSDRTPDEVLDAQPTFIDRIGMSRFLSSQRSNGLHAMIKQIKYYAAAFKSMQAQEN
jgi:cysteine desulfuration protein SufE